MPTLWSLLVAFAAALNLGASAAAGATSVAPDLTNTGGLEVTDQTGETNNMTVRAESGELIFEDTSAVLTTTASQCSVPPGTAHQVRCGSAGLVSLVVWLNAGSDVFRLDDSASTVATIAFALVSGGTGDDQLSTGPSADQLFGGPGEDRLDAGPGHDVVEGLDDNDPAVVGGAGPDVVNGGDGKDHVFGGEGPDNVNGEDGNDEVDGGEGNDDARGGAGDDTVAGGTGDDELEDPDLADLTEDPTAGDGSDTLMGGPGNDRLGGGTDDTHEPDTFSGGDGFDTADFRARTSSVKIDLDGAADDGVAGEDDNVQSDIEAVIGGVNDDELTGSAASNSLDGRGGDDTIAGRGGDDTLVGGVNDPGSDNLSGDAGSDTMSGGPGDDALSGGDGLDTEYGGGGTDTVEGDDGDDSLAGGAGGDTINGDAGNDVLNGGDVGLVGGDAGDRLNGGPGADKLSGGRGNDELDGGLGPDDISGGAEKDTVSYEDRTGRVFVTLDGQANDGETGEGDNVFPDVEAIVGGLRGDDLLGDADNNNVDGGDGEDWLVGDLGPDRLLGGDAPDIVQARDGIADEVACGDGDDLVIADPKDKAIDCETRDVPGARRLIVGRYALLRPEGKFALQLPGGRRFFDLTGTLRIPIGSTIDPENSVVRLATAKNRSGARQVALVAGGRFRVRQRGDRRPITELRLAEAFPDCPRSSRARRFAKRRPARKLELDIGKNKVPRRRYEVRGKYSVAGATGTAWVTEDRCDGTLTTVRSGAVRVQNLARNRTKIVKAGQSYLARPL
jgi:Ca2+-binding RTX toxin-like protein